MTPVALLQHLQSKGVGFQTTPGTSDRLRILDPQGITTSEQREVLSSAKIELIEYLRGASNLNQPSLSAVRLHMLDHHGCVTKDPAKCYMWTREQLGYGWWYPPANPPPLI